MSINRVVAATVVAAAAIGVPGSALAIGSAGPGPKSAAPPAAAAPAAKAGACLTCHALASAARDRPRAGLGLAIVGQVARANRATVGVQTGAGGSTFTLVFAPLASFLSTEADLDLTRRVPAAATRAGGSLS